MCTASGKHNLNLAAHTCRCFLTFLQQVLLWHWRNNTEKSVSLWFLEIFVRVQADLQTEISTIFEIWNLRSWGSMYMLEVWNTAARVNLKGFVRLFHWRLSCAHPPELILREACFKMMCFCTCPEYHPMWTASGKHILNLAAHTCRCCLTFLQQHLLWHWRNNTRN